MPAARDRRKKRKFVEDELEVEQTTEDQVDLYDEIRSYRGMRSLTDGQVRNLILLLSRFGLEPSILDGPDRATRTAITAHVSPGFLVHFKQLAIDYGLSPSNLARIVLSGWVVATEHPKRPGRPELAPEDL